MKLNAENRNCFVSVRRDEPVKVSRDWHDTKANTRPGYKDKIEPEVQMPAIFWSYND